MRLSDVVRLYDTTARYWDSPIHRGVYRHSYVRLFRRLEAQGWFGQLSRHLRVLDCGTGAGLLMTSLLGAAARPVDLYGVDASTEMLKRARSRLHRLGDRARVVVANVESLPFGDREMDIVMAALVLEHSPRPSAALREMARVACRNATLLFITTRPHAPDLPFRLRFRYQPLPHRELLEWMGEAGIRNICSEPLSGLARPFARVYVGTKPK